MDDVQSQLHSATLAMESESHGKTDLQRKINENDSCITLVKLSGKSEVLKRFFKVEREGVETLYAVCRKCKVVVKYTSQPEMSGLQRHSCTTAL